jgi:hypothetical protein
VLLVMALAKIASILAKVNFELIPFLQLKLEAIQKQ